MFIGLCPSNYIDQEMVYSAVRRKAHCEHRSSIFFELIVAFLYQYQSGDSIYDEAFRLFTFLQLISNLVKNSKLNLLLSISLSKSSYLLSIDFKKF